MIGLGLKLMQELGVDVVLGATRKDLKVNEISAQHGFETLIPSIMKCKYECEMMGAFKERIKSYPDELTRNMIEQLWSEKFDFRTTDAGFKNYPVRKVA